MLPKFLIVVFAAHIAAAAIAAPGPRTFTAIVEFSNGASEISASEESQIEDLASSLHRLPGCISIVVVTGHADRTEGDRSKRESLSRDRSAFVAERLKRFGKWQVSSLIDQYEFVRPGFIGKWQGHVDVEAIYRPLTKC